MYSFLSTLCIAALFLIIAVWFVALLIKPRAEKIDFMRKFKKGDCVIVYLVAIPLYAMGLIYGGEDFIPAVFKAIDKTLDLVVLNYDMQSVEALMANNDLYSFAIYLSFALVTVNAVLFAVSLLHQKIWEFIERTSWQWSFKEKILIVGCNEGNRKIYESIKKGSAILLDDIPEEEKTKLYAEKIRFVSKSASTVSRSGSTENSLEKFCRQTLTKCLRSAKRSCMIVVNTGDDERNISICNGIIAASNHFFEGKDAISVAAVLERVKVYVFGSAEYEDIYHELAETSDGCIRYVNKHRQIAVDFVEKYPLTQFMTAKHINYETSLLRDGTDVNVIMLGFGKTNRQIFLTSVANNQFLTEKDGEKTIKQVKYHIFDNCHLKNNKNLNHSYYRFENEFEDEIKAQASGNNSYLPFPTAPAEAHYGKLDLNDEEFYKAIKSVLVGKEKFNYVIVSFGSDLEHVDMAQKLISKKLEWGLEDTYVFVRVRSGKSSYDIFKREDCYLIGDESRAIYDIERIDNDIITNMAKMRNKIDALERDIAGSPNKMPTKPIESVYAQADRDWYVKKTQNERESNIYGCLSLRSKLHLMGLDYCLKNDKENAIRLTKEAYLDIYAGEDLPEYYKGVLADGKDIVRYGLDFADSRRKTMAIHEHLRWNSFMISKGFVPASRAEILADKNKNGKNYAIRRHGNLTTFDGLVEFRKMVADRDGVSELQTDVIKYDYQLLDDAFWLLDKNGYAIISRER